MSGRLVDGLRVLLDHERQDVRIESIHEHILGQPVQCNIAQRMEQGRFDRRRVVSCQSVEVVVSLVRRAEDDMNDRPFSFLSGSACAARDVPVVTRRNPLHDSGFSRVSSATMDYHRPYWQVDALGESVRSNEHREPSLTEVCLHSLTHHLRNLAVMHGHASGKSACDCMVRAQPYSSARAADLDRPTSNLQAPLRRVGRFEPFDQRLRRPVGIPWRRTEDQDRT